VYASVGSLPDEAGTPAFVSLKRNAQRNLDALIGRGAFGPRFEFLLRKFAQDATDYRTIVPMLAASAVSGLVKAGTLGRLLGSGSASWYTRGLGARGIAGGLALAAEVPTFTLSARALRGIGGNAVNSERTLGEDLLAAGLTLSCLKFSSYAGEAAFRRLNLASPSYMNTFVSQGAAFGGLLGAQRLEEALLLEHA